MKTFGGWRWWHIVLWKIGLHSNAFCGHNTIPHLFLHGKARVRGLLSSGFFFFPEIIFAFQSWIQVPTDGAGLSWPGCVSKQAISLVFFIFPSKNGLKKKKTSVKFSEIPWNAAVTFIIPSLLRLCCAIELGSHWVSAGMWEQGRDIKSSTSHYIPKNSREEMPGRTFAPWKMSGKVAPSKSAQHEEQNSHRASPSPDSEIWLFRESLRACF